jgi:hypothetical protein
MNDGILDIRLAVARQPGAPTYVSRRPFVRRGMGLRDPVSGMFNTSGADWDAGIVFMATGLIQTNTGLRMMYFGSQVTHAHAAYIAEGLNLDSVGRGAYGQPTPLRLPGTAPTATAVGCRTVLGG